MANTTRAAYYKSPATLSYPVASPFDPPESFGELREIIRPPAIDTGNRVYPLVRELLTTLGLDVQRQGTAGWNPLGDVLKKGQHVLIKPNFVSHYHTRGDAAIFWMVTHPSIIRALVDYASLAVGPTGRITIGDTPIENCDFGVLCKLTGLADMVGVLKARGYKNLQLRDFRTYQTAQYPDGSVETTDLPGDPAGYTDIDLGEASLFQKLEALHGQQNYYTLGDHTVDHLDPQNRTVGLPNKHHHVGRHLYRIANTVLDADCVISVAKLKTHKFAGVTLCLKNAIGIGQGKEYLPHRRPGTPSESGDSFAAYPSPRYVKRLRRRRALLSVVGGKNAMALRSLIRQVIPAKLPHEVYSEPLYGDWYGNDTIWRTTLDLNLVLLHADRAGLDLTHSKRTYLGVIDGVVGMDHEAPMAGLPVNSGLLIAARDPVAADTLGCYLMGFDPRMIPTIAEATAPQCSYLGPAPYDLGASVGNMPLEESRCEFVPTKGWTPTLPQHRRRGA